MAEFLFSLAILLLGAASIFWVLDLKRKAVPIWRRLVSFDALFAIYTSVVVLVRCRAAVQHVDFPQELNIVPHFALIGLLLIGTALLAGCFAPQKMQLFLLPSTMIIGFLWLGALAAL